MAASFATRSTRSLLLPCSAAIAVALTITLAGGPARAAAAPGLGTAADFAVLAGSTITSTGFTSISGDLGLDPGTAITGFPPGVVNGTINTAGATANTAQTDAAASYAQLAAQAPTQIISADLGGTTLEPGVYSGTALTLGGTLILDARNDPDAVFVFQSDSTLGAAANSIVTLVNGANDCNVYWQVGSSATLGTGAAFVGTILADVSITANTAASVDGRLLARTGAVTLDTNQISTPACVIAPFDPTIDPSTDVPTTVVPTTDVPTTDTPTTDVPTTDTPTTDVPTTDTPTTDVPTTDTPTTEVPTTDTPTTDVPTSDSPTTDEPVIIPTTAPVTSAHRGTITHARTHTGTVSAVNASAGTTSATITAPSTDTHTDTTTLASTGANVSTALVTGLVAVLFGVALLISARVRRASPTHRR